MNKKISKTLLVLLITYLVAFYILKYAFPHIFLEMLISPNVIKLGDFLQSWTGYEHLYKLLATMLTLYLYVCAGCGKFKFKWYEAIYIVLGAVVCQCCFKFTPELYTHTTIFVMLLLSLLCKGNFAYSVVAFGIHGYMSQFLLSVRGFETILQYYNLATGLMLSLEGYVWLMVLALFFSLRRVK